MLRADHLNDRLPIQAFQIPFWPTFKPSSLRCVSKKHGRTPLFKSCRNVFPICRLDRSESGDVENGDMSDQVFKSNESTDVNSSEKGDIDAFVQELKTLSPSAVKDQLIHTLEVMINDDFQVSKVEQSILHLESLKATPITPEFTELALAGTWNLRFSSMRPLVSSKIRLREILQTVDPENKQLINKVLWSFLSKSGERYINAVLTVDCSYVFVGPGRLDVSLKKHTIKISDNQEASKDLPEDMQGVVNQLRLALPIEYFDPSGLSDASYIEPELRICRFLGKRLAGVRNIFIRRQPQAESN